MVFFESLSFFLKEHFSAFFSSRFFFILCSTFESDFNELLRVEDLKIYSILESHFLKANFRF